jgi:hypothetical protein
MCAVAAKQTENGLHKERRFDQVAVGETCEILEVCDVVALEFKTRAVAVAGRKNKFDIFITVAKDQVASGLEMCLLPIELELVVLRNQVIQAEIYRAHVQ